MTDIVDRLTRLIQDLDDAKNVRPDFKGMLYGDSGTGKTVTAVRLAQKITGDDKTILHLDSGQGWVSLENHAGLKKRVKRLRCTGLTVIEAVAAAVKHGENVFGNVGTIIVDEASTIATIALDRVIDKRASEDPEKDPDTPTQPDFNTAGNRTRKAFTALYDLVGVHIILISHLRKDKDNRGVEVVSPNFQPKINSRLREPLHLVGYMTADLLRDSGDGHGPKYNRLMQVHPSRQVVAKTRIGGFQAEITQTEFIERTAEWIKGEQTTELEPEVTADSPEEPEEFAGIPVEGE